MNHRTINYQKIKTNQLIRGTIVLTIASFFTRIIGFLFRIFLTSKIGAEGLGIYQLIFPVQIICYSICCSGIELAISRLTAAHKSSKYFLCGLSLSILCGTICALVLFFCADDICTNIIFEPRCVNLIKVLAFLIPLTCIHSCVSSYFIGCKQIKLTALGQMIEQIARVLSITGFIYLFEYLHMEVSPVCAVLGSLTGEMCSTFFCICRFRKINRRTTDTLQIQQKRQLLREITYLSLPVTLNRLMLSILQSIQSVLIPSMLIIYGLSSKQSLEIYGILLGLVIPFILFPGALINSFSTLLLPEISKADSSHDEAKIHRTTRQTIYFCTIFGLLCSLIFILFGRLFGTFLFHSETAGSFIAELGIICPFIYLNQTLSSIINGLGKTGVTFIIGTLCTALQIFLIIKLMPATGIAGYILSFFISNSLNSVLLYLYIKKQVFHKTEQL